MNPAERRGFGVGREDGGEVGYDKKKSKSGRI